MPTIKQKRVAKLIIENHEASKPLTGAEIVANSGYGESMSSYPKRVIDTEGVKEALSDYGFSVDNAKQVVASILLDEEKDPNSRLKASDMIFKVHGAYAPDKHINLNIENEPSERIKELAKKLNEKNTVE